MNGICCHRSTGLPSSTDLWVQSWSLHSNKYQEIVFHSNKYIWWNLLYSCVTSLLYTVPLNQEVRQHPILYTSSMEYATSALTGYISRLSLSLSKRVHTWQAGAAVHVHGQPCTCTQHAGGCPEPLTLTSRLPSWPQLQFVCSTSSLLAFRPVCLIYKP